MSLALVSARHGRPLSLALAHRPPVRTFGLILFPHEPPPPPPTTACQRTPLHCAAKGNTTAVARYLISVGADTEARTAYKMTPLHVAAFYGSADVMRMLLEEVQDLDIDALDFGSCET